MTSTIIEVYDRHGTLIKSSGYTSHNTLVFTAPSTWDQVIQEIRTRRMIDSALTVKGIRMKLINPEKMSDQELGNLLEKDSVSKKNEGRYDAARIVKEAAKRLKGGN